MRRSRIRAYKGGWAVVTGAARDVGLGYAFARQLAAELEPDSRRCARRRAVRAGPRLRSEFGVEVRAVPCDMGDTNAIEQIEQAAGGADIDVLVCNHMFTPPDTPRILDMPLDVHRRMIDINARGYTRSGAPLRQSDACTRDEVRSSSCRRESAWTSSPSLTGACQREQGLPDLSRRGVVVR